MNKRHFLQTLGVLGASSLLPSPLRSEQRPPENAATCTLIPSETAGPFPLDLTDNAFFFRQDVREDRLGVPLRLRMRIIGDANCEPLSNVRVHIWHCDRDGQYSGYSLPSNPGQEGLTYLRGYQVTDANGEVEFTTIFPGWYPGRVCHIHFQVYVSSSYSAVSQLTFDHATKQTVYAQFAELYPEGADPLTPEQDGAFADGYAYQAATLAIADGNDAVESFLEVTVRGTGTTSVGYLERENAKRFALGQNVPNPVDDHASIPLTMKVAADVALNLYDLNGRQVAQLHNGWLDAGDHRVVVPASVLTGAAGSMVYQVRVRTADGTYTDHRVLTKR